jgi:hypothetical protein
MVVIEMIFIIINRGCKDCDWIYSDQFELFMSQGVTVILKKSGLLLNQNNN